MGKRLLFLIGVFPWLSHPINLSSHRRDSLGQNRGKFVIPEDFNAPLPDDILAAFEGYEE